MARIVNEGEAFQSGVDIVRCLRFHPEFSITREESSSFPPHFNNLDGIRTLVLFLLLSKPDLKAQLAEVENKRSEKCHSSH